LRGKFVGDREEITDFNGWFPEGSFFQKTALRTSRKKLFSLPSPSFECDFVRNAALHFVGNFAFRGGKNPVIPIISLAGLLKFPDKNRTIIFTML
jgi:hypothetical protein